MIPGSLTPDGVGNIIPPSFSIVLNPGLGQIFLAESFLTVTYQGVVPFLAQSGTIHVQATIQGIGNQFGIFYDARGYAGNITPATLSSDRVAGNYGTFIATRIG